MFINIVLLGVGMILLIQGADWFVGGSSKIAKALHVSPLIIGLTLVSMGTSAPEASVSITSAINNMSDLSFGNIVGSNIFNVFIVLGVSAIITPLVVSKNISKYDIPIALLICLVILLFGFVITPLCFDRIESIILLLGFISYMIFLVIRSKKDIPLEVEEETKTSPLIKNIVLVLIGLGAVIFGGDLVVKNASDIAAELGMSEVLIGLTIVAIGTSLPELVTSIVAAKKHENDIAIGNVIGSCIFNVIFILGLSSTIRPMVISMNGLVDVLVMLGSIVLLMIFTFKNKKINKWQGIIFILLYIAYTIFIIIRS